MTHYWWMHWFWITLWISLPNFKVSSTTLYSSSTIEPFLNVSNESNRTAKAIGNITVPLTFESPSTVVKNVTISKITSITKSTKPYLKKIDYHFHNSTTRAGQEDNAVINQRNLTELLNVTDQLLINSSISGDIHTDNLTYLQEEASSIQNSERIGIEEIVEEGVNVPIGNLSAAGITGITLGCVVIVGILCGVSYFMYHNRGFNRPQVLNDHCSNPDSSGYIDDASVRDNSEEMYSLDNDSFLNSLEAMTIQNYWTDTVKHTKL